MSDVLWEGFLALLLIFLVVGGFVAAVVFLS